MHPRAHPYLSAAFAGRSTPFDVAMGALFIIAAWLLTQVVIGGAAFTLDLGPEIAELRAEMDREMRASANADMDVGTALGILLGLVGVVLAPLGYLIYRTASALAGRILGWSGLAGVVVAATVLVLGATGGTGPAAESFQAALLGTSALAYALVLFSFVGAFVGAWLVQHFVHARTLTSLLTAARRIRWSRLVWAAALTLGVYGLLAWGLSLFGIGEYRVNPERSRMLPFLLATLLFIPVQASAEEVIFRGYLNQALARVIPSALVVFAITSVAFGALHLANPEIAAAKADGTFWVAFAGYCLFGFVLCLVVWFDNGLEAACGIHIANNIFAATFINYDNSALPIPGLWITESAGAATEAMTALALLGLVAAILWWTRLPLTDPGEPLLHPVRDSTPGDPREASA